MESKFLKNNDKISGQEFKKIIGKFGADKVSLNGQDPVSFSAGDIEDKDEFTVVINYGYEVQFRYQVDDVRGVFTTGLKGKCDEVGWFAEC